jgi:hypothetical protein
VREGVRLLLSCPESKAVPPYTAIRGDFQDDHAKVGHDFIKSIKFVNIFLH